MCVCVCGYMCACVCIWVCVHIQCVYVYVCMHVYIGICIYVYVCMMCVCVYVHTVYICICVQCVCVSVCSFKIGFIKWSTSPGLSSCGIPTATLLVLFARKASGLWDMRYLGFPFCYSWFGVLCCFNLQPFQNFPEAQSLHLL